MGSQAAGSVYSTYSNSRHLPGCGVSWGLVLKVFTVEPEQLIFNWQVMLQLVELSTNKYTILWWQTKKGRERYVCVCGGGGGGRRDILINDITDEQVLSQQTLKLGREKQQQQKNHVYV